MAGCFHLSPMQPQGGVKAGQTFFTPLRNYNGPNIKAPSGHWKDGPFNCLSLGILSPHLWCAWCFTQCKLRFCFVHFLNIFLHYILAVSCLFSMAKVQWAK